MKRTASIETVPLYPHVSTKDRRDDTEIQLIQLRDYCAKQGREIAGEYIDHETGGRPHSQQMFKGARVRKFKVVLFWSLDRLRSESVTMTLGYLERLAAAGAKWRSFTEKYLDSCRLFRDAVLSILATIAKHERIRCGERAIARLRRQGKSITSGAGGSRWAKLEIVRRLHEEGSSLRKIAARVRVSPMSVPRVLNGVV